MQNYHCSREAVLARPAAAWLRLLRASPGGSSLRRRARLHRHWARRWAACLQGGGGLVSAEARPKRGPRVQLGSEPPSLQKSSRSFNSTMFHSPWKERACDARRLSTRNRQTFRHPQDKVQANPPGSSSYSYYSMYLFLVLQLPRLPCTLPAAFMTAVIPRFSSCPPVPVHTRFPCRGPAPPAARGSPPGAKEHGLVLDPH